MAKGPANLPHNRWFTGHDALANLINMFRIASDGVMEIGDGVTPIRVMASDFTEVMTPVTINAQNGTLLAASIAAGLIVHVSQTGGGTLTFDTGANLDTQFPNWPIGSVKKFGLVNDGNQTDTLAVAAGVTIENVANTIAAGEGAEIWLRKTAAQTYVAYIIN